MTDKANSSPVVAASGDALAAPVAAPKKAAAKSSKPRAKPARPKIADMVTAAIVALKEHSGSSLQAIKKYMAGTYKIDTEKQTTFIKKYLKTAVASGTLVQTKGKGAAGSFKLAKVETVNPKVNPSTTAKAPKKVAVTKKPATDKKPVAAAVRKASPKKPAARPVSPKKKAASKAPAAKPPKPKTTKTKAAQKSPAQKSKPSTAKKTKPVAAKAKKVAPKKTATAKK